MISRDAIERLSLRVSALRQAMDAVRQDSTPDHAKWGCAPSFASVHADLAAEFCRVTGRSDIKCYNKLSLPSWANMIWPEQKVMFDVLYGEVLVLHGEIDRLKTPDLNQNMYNLFVSGDCDDWNGSPFQIGLGRCVREYTNQRVTEIYGQLDGDSVSHLIQLPCIFAYEKHCEKPPKFGYIKEIISRQNEVRIEYKIVDVHPFLSVSDFERMYFDLDVGKMEMFRTHWAVKQVNLRKALIPFGIALPVLTDDVINPVDLSTHTFFVALSFPGESRALVEMVAAELERTLGPNSYFYDNNYTSQLARPSLDVLLQGIYSRAKLDVVFVGANYQNKDWCGVEFRAIREIIMARETDRVMFVRTDDGAVDGVFRTDGYVDARQHDPARIASFICERVRLLSARSSVG